MRWLGLRERRGLARRGPAAALISALVATLLGIQASPAAAVTSPTWRGEYFVGTDLAGSPTLVREDASIDFDWATGSPAPSLPADRFSVRWSRTLAFSAGTWRFSTYTDDGVRLTIDGTTRIDKWQLQGATQFQADVVLGAGEHTVVMEFFENEGWALAKLSFHPVGVTIPSGQWMGEYWDNPAFQGNPAMVRADAAIEFDWGVGSPAANFPSDDFSVRWTRTLTLAAGRWAFSTYTDDGVRLYVDGVLVIDQWLAQSATLHRAEIDLAAGDHVVRMDYFESAGAAVAELGWGKIGGSTDIRIDVGGSGYVDKRNEAWLADQSFVGGVTTTVAQPIWNTSDDALYTSERAVNFGYAIPVPNGSYKLRLHFAELIQDSSGVRQFDVTAEGLPLLTKFDIHGAAGKASLVTATFDVTVGDGQLTLQFKNVFNNAVLQALDVYPSSTTRDLMRPIFGAVPEPENATYSTPPTVTLSVTDDVGLKDGYWRIDDEPVQALFGNLGSAGYSGQFTLPVDAFNALSLGPHTLSFGANDAAGNAWVKKWAFRKLDSGAGSEPIAFDRRVLANKTTAGAGALDQPTSMTFGPDGRLYVAQQNGYIHVLTLDANRNVVTVGRIDAIHDYPNTNNDGSPATGVVGRHLLGIEFDPSSTVEQPILWTVHSDPRICFNKTPSTCPVNTTSGVVTRLVGPSFDSAANRKDYVTGLPRSRENHSPNAVHFGPDGWLYLTIGSNTNYGAPSTAFSGLAEVYLTAGIVRMNVNAAASSFPIDVRNVVSKTTEKPGIFELYATGYRNAYDFWFHSNGRLYLNGNAGNLASGNTPGPGDGCPSGVSIDPGNRSDYLTIVRQGDHGGHPNPARAQCVLDDGTMYPTPLPADANYRPPILFYSNGTSSNGMTEYLAPTFGGQMLANIISTTFAGSQAVRRVVLSADGSQAIFEENLGTFVQPLDVAVGPDGSIYVAEHGGDDVVILEPDPPLTGTWDVGPQLPVPTQEIGAVECAGRMYVLGGLVGQNADTNDVWAFDPATSLWTQRADIPNAGVDHPGAACVNGKVYLMGGLLNAGSPVATVFEYNPSTNAWIQKASMPRARGAMGVAVLNGKIYAAGGLAPSAGSVTDMAVFDPTTNSWQTLAPMLTPRDHLIMEAMDGELYAIGGRTNGFTNVLAVNERYDPSTNVWVPRAPMPVARAAMASGTLNGHIQIWGGEGPSGTPSSTYKQGHDFDPGTDTWITVADQPTPRHGTDGVTIGPHVHVAGGGPQAGASVTDVHEIFGFVTSSGPSSCVPPGSDPDTTDSDGDGYTDQDEADNGTNPCSAASVPPDNDGDHVSDLNDPDDDDDGIADLGDQFQLDPANGTATTLPWVQDWNPGDPPAGEFGNTGFPGVQLTTNGTGFIANRVHAGGAGGFTSIDATSGTHRGAADSQDDALQVGFDARSPVTISTRIADPFSGQGTQAGKSGGIYVGLDEDAYVSVGIASDNGAGATGFLCVIETGGTATVNPGGSPVTLAMPGPSTVDLFLVLDPAAKRVTAHYRVDSSAAADIRPICSVDAATFPGLATFFRLGAAGGLVTTTPTGTGFGVAYDYFRIEATSTPPPSALSITTATLPDGTTSQSYAATLAATGGLPPYAWSIASGSLPAGITLDGSTGALSGTPTAAGLSTVTFRATDSGSPSQTVTKALGIDIRSPVAISTSALPNGRVGLAYDSALAAAGGKAPYAWSIATGTLPAGLILNATTGAITGTPTTAGTASLTFRVTDSGMPARTATRALSITIDPAVLSITTASLPGATAGQSYSATLAASGGTPPYAWSIASGSLPAGLSLNATSGVISGTPTTAGTASFVVRATDAGSPAQAATRSLAITVSSGPLQITTLSLPSGKLGVPYSVTLQATGGAPPYTWSIAAGSLPPGLMLNGVTGVISGTPTKQGQYAVTIRLVDSANPAGSVSRTYALRVWRH